MATVRHFSASLASLLLLALTTMMTQATPNRRNEGEGFQALPPNGGPITASLGSPPTEEFAGSADEAIFRQLAAEFLQEGNLMAKALQARLALLGQLVSAGSNRLRPSDPTGASAVPESVILSELDGEVSPDDVEKRENLSPTERVMVRREIMRRLRERAPQPVELPIGMRFKKFPLTTFSDFQNLYHDGDGGAKRGGEELDSSRRAAIRAAILRHLGQNRQPVELPGMRGGK